MIQAQSKTFQDVINYENQLDAKIKHVIDLIDEAVPPVTQGQKSRARDLINEWVEIKKGIRQVTNEEVKRLNEMIKNSNVPFISTERNTGKPASKS